MDTVLTPEDHRTSLPEDWIVHHVDDDCIIAVFEYLYTHHKPRDAIRWIITCTRIKAPFADVSLGSGHLAECKARGKTRMPVNLKDSWPYVAQLAREEISKNRAAGFFKACEMLAMHCATDCCGLARGEFNRYYSKKFAKLDPVSTAVRLIAAPAETNAIFTYGRERVRNDAPNARKSTHHSVIRKHNGTGRDRIIVPETYFRFVHELIPSPDGRYCAFVVLAQDTMTRNRVKVFVWDTMADAPGGDTLTEHAHRLPSDEKDMMSRFPSRVWWCYAAEGEHALVTAWTQSFYDCMNSLSWSTESPSDSQNEGGLLYVYDYGNGPEFKPRMQHFFNINNMREPSRHQRFGPIRADNCNLCAFYTASHTQGFQGDIRCNDCFYLVVLDINGENRPVYLTTFNAGQIYPSPSLTEEREVVHSPIAVAISATGSHIAVLAKDFKWRMRVERSVMYFVLYTWDEATKCFVRKLGPKDEIRIHVGPTQEPAGWEAEFSPCGAYVSLTYGHNRFGPNRNLVTDGHYFDHAVDDPDNPDHHPTSHVAEAAVHIIHISPTGLRQSQIVDCPRIRQLRWANSAMIVMPKHGVVRLV